MKKQIYPSLIARNQRELDERFEKIRGLSGYFHLDIMDGKFVKNKSLWFDFKLPKTKKYYAHLMVENPENWIKKNSGKVLGVTIHSKSRNVEKAIDLLRRKRKNICLAINPGVKVSEVSSLLKKVDAVLVMTVHPGKYGSRFLPVDLKKIKKIKKDSGIMIGVDGGISDKTISRASKAGADYFVVGSYLQKAGDCKKALKALKKKIG